jgi:hypothetical protein
VPRTMAGRFRSGREAPDNGEAAPPLLRQCGYLVRVGLSPLTQPIPEVGLTRTRPFASRPFGPVCLCRGVPYGVRRRDASRIAQPRIRDAWLCWGTWQPLLRWLPAVERMSRRGTTWACHRGCAGRARSGYRCCPIFLAARAVAIAASCASGLSCGSRFISSSMWGTGRTRP